ncbi:MAG: glycosyltransferase [Cyanobacteriota bacterium]|nr:glycosyltransferase [Cyanobacteriota bacterium]
MGAPSCSVVLASHELTEPFFESVQSALIALERCPGAVECVVVLDGRPTQDRHRVLARFSAGQVPLHVSCMPAGGLTRALIEGCDRAQGAFLARLDVGDLMTHDRLALQLSAMSADPHCVLATSAVEVCGPRWESLWVNRGTESLAGFPTRVDQSPPTEGLVMDIPHHSSVMFRRSAYEAVGGYRKAFYFGQDWDLWYRLATAGTFVHLPQVLTRVRLFSQGLSSRHWREQRDIASLSLACYVARSHGQPETTLLQQAAAILPKPKEESLFPWDGRRAEGAYFIAEALRRNRDPRCHCYFLEAIRLGFWKPRIWLRLIQSLSLL